MLFKNKGLSVLELEVEILRDRVAKPIIIQGYYLPGLLADCLTKGQVGFCWRKGIGVLG